ncbi:MAG TPA: hypothetical protein VH541_03270 [Gaiellaceae bacterium]
MLADVWETMAVDAAAESTLWADCLLTDGDRDRTAVFSTLGEARYALGLETIYEGYLVHYGRPRLFAPLDDDSALLLGDYLYAHGVARISALHDVAAVADLAELISLCSQVRAEETDGDGALWAATAALLGRGMLDEARTALRLHADPQPLELAARSASGDEAVDTALAAHAAHRAA